MKLSKTANYISYEGAHTLARTIKAFWAKHGKKVKPVVVHYGDMFFVRSDMKNGFPAA